MISRSSVLLFAISLLFSLPIFSQKYDWEEKPVIPELTAEEKKEPSVLLSEYNKIIFSYDEREGALKQRTIRHYMIKVNNSKGVEDNNQVYIPLRDAVLIEAKARVIRKDGSMVVLNKSSIKEAKEMENLGAYKYFAIEGAEEGSVIEYMYIVDEDPEINGVRETVQGGDPVKKYHFELISPSHLHWGFKSYNGLPDVKEDTAETKNNRYYLDVENIWPLPDEKYAYNDLNEKFLVYRLERNSSSNSKKITNFLNISNNIYQNIHTPIGKAALKKYNAIIKELGIQSGNTLENVRKFEDYIKHNFQMSMEKDPNFYDPNFLLENKIGNDRAFTSLFVHFLEDQGIKYELGLTSDRSERIFDPEFDAYYVLDEYFIYLPQENVFLAPSWFSSRVGFLPPFFTDNHGLFIKSVSLGGSVNGIGRVAYIPTRPATDSYFKETLDLYISDDFSETKGKFVREMGGYTGAELQPIYSLMSPEDRKKTIDEFVKIGGDEDKIVSTKVSGYEPNEILTKPFRIEAEVVSETLVEKAGNKYIFKIGQAFGEQVEMFQENKRVQPVHMPYNHIQQKVIRVHIPAGYKIRNPEVLANDIRHQYDGKDACGFTSKYQIEGNVLTVDIYEYYNMTRLPIDMYEEFESVINASANFFETAIQLEKI